MKKNNLENYDVDTKEKALALIPALMEQFKIDLTDIHALLVYLRLLKDKELNKKFINSLKKVL